MKRILTTAVLLLVVGAGAAQAQEKSSVANARLSGLMFPYQVAKGYLTKTIDQISQDNLAYQPTKEVRTFGAIIGHVADANRMFCAIADGKPAPSENAGSEKLTDKAALAAALKSAFEYCDAVTARLTDADLARPAELFGNKTNVAGVLSLNAAHNFEHYGNLVTYMRLNGIVPPSSQQ